MNGFTVGDWDDRLDAERLRMEIVEAFEACISDKAIQKRENSGKSSNGTQKSAWNGLETGFPGVDGFCADDSRPKRLKLL
jgi:hypothetical protein